MIKQSSIQCLSPPLSSVKNTSLAAISRGGSGKNDVILYARIGLIGWLVRFDSRFIPV